MPVFNGTPQDDFLVGSPQDDVITGIDGNDTLIGLEGDDDLDGGEGSDFLRGGDGNDIVRGGDGNDYLQGSEGNDIIDGGDGFDRAAFVLQPGDLQVGATVNLNLQGVAQNTGHGRDILISVEHVSGTIYADTLTGDAGDNWLWGQGGNDVLNGRDGNDLLEVGTGNNVVNGGNGRDTVSFNNNGDFVNGVTVSLALQGAAQNTGGGSMTLSAVENLSGSQANDTLTGDGQANILAGGAGSDVLNGAGGDDVLLGDGFFGIASQGLGRSGPIFLYEDILTFEGTPELGGADTLNGGAGHDVLRGGAGNDTLNGGDDDDLLDGGAGSDVLNGADGNDTVTYAYRGGGMFLNLSVQGVAQVAGGENDTLIGIENAIGTSFNDNIRGNEQANFIQLGAGNDLSHGGLGADTIEGGDGNDVIWHGANIDMLTGAQVDPVTGAILGLAHDDGAVDTLSGGAGNDVIYVGLGDVASGGDDFDRLFVSFFARGSALNLDLSNGNAMAILAGLTGGTYSGFEEFGIFGTLFDDTVRGTAGSDRIYDNFGFNTFFGGDGNDLLSGGFDGSLLYGEGGDDILYNGAGVDGLYGGEGDDLIIYGSSLGPVLDPPVAANDTLAGDAGRDRIDFASVVPADGQGVRVNLTVTTAQNINFGRVTITGVEDLSGSAFADTFTGNDEANTLFGRAGDDTLIGGRGDDVLEGGLGDDLLDGSGGADTATYASATAGVSVNLGLTTAQNTGGAGIDRLLRIENLTGSAFADILTGSTGNNVLMGGAGDDVLDGGRGDDTLDGGDGIDTATYALASAAVVVNLATGRATGGHGRDNLVSIETVVGSNHDDTITGDDGANRLVGGGGNDLMAGGRGDDILDGGTGRDRADYSAAESGVSVDLTVLGGQDTGGAGVDTLISIEDVSGSRFSDTLTGNAAANALSGGGGNDVLNGGDGNDTLEGGNGADTLNGGAGIDILTGGLAGDVLTGGAGRDTFVYLAVTESTATARDLITDMSALDILDLSAIDAHTNLAGDQAFVRATSLGGTAGLFTLTYDAGTGQSLLRADVNGDGVADLVIAFTGDVTGQGAGWVL